MSNTSHFCHQVTDTKNKCIDQVYIKVIDRRIQDQMDKMTMNRHLQLVCMKIVTRVSIINRDMIKQIESQVSSDMLLVS